MRLTESSGRVDLASLVDGMSEQPEFFDREQLPVEPATVCAARTFSFSGRTTCRDEARALTIAALRLSGVSKREIARQMGCSRNTIDAVMEVLEARGKVEPLKERLPRALAGAALEAVEWAREIIDSREVSSEHAATLRALGVLGGIGSDKVAAAVQVAGDLHVHQSVHLEGADPMRAWLQERAERLSTDSHAAGAVPNSHGSNATPQPTAAQAAAPQPPAIDVEASAAPDHPDQAEAGDAGPGGGGGGRGARGSGDR